MVFVEITYGSYLQNSLETFYSCRHNQQDLFNAMGSMYSSVLFMGVQNSASVQPVVAVERTVFYRERAAHMYSPLPYALGQVNFLCINFHRSYVMSRPNSLVHPLVLGYCPWDLCGPYRPILVFHV